VALAPVPSMPPLVLVAHDDPGTADSLRHAVETAAGWQVLLADPSPAGLAAALTAGPSVALVGCATLANLPAECRTPLVAIGDDDHPADVRAALAAGARSLLAWPDGVADLPGELARLADPGQPAPAADLPGLVVAIRGVQGGAGTTTVAIHLAAAWARWGPAPVLLLDLAGGLAFRLDLGAVPTWSTLTVGTAVAAADAGVHASGPATLDPGVGPGPGGLDPGIGALGTGPADLGIGAPGTGLADLETGAPGTGLADVGTGGVGSGRPDAATRVAGSSPPDLGTGVLGSGLPGPVADGLDPRDLAGLVAEPWAGLSVLPLAGPADGVSDPPPEPWLVRNVLDVARTVYRVVVVDLPAVDGPAVRTALSQVDVLVAVGRCETAGVRGLQAALDGWAADGHDPDAVGAVVTGVRPQAPLAPREVRAALGDRLWGLVPAAAAELAAAAEDGVLLLDRHDLPAVQAMVTLANRVVPFAAVSA
jgi:cellulose biosynthesis protein BcsQ